MIAANPRQTERTDSLSGHVPKLLARYRVHVDESRYVGYLVDESRTYILRGFLYRLVLPYLNGRHTVDEIAHRLAFFTTADQVRLVIEHLRKKGHLQDTSVRLPEKVCDIAARCRVDSKTAENRLREKSVSILALAKTELTPLRTGLESLSVAVGEKADLQVVVTEDYLDDALSNINRQALATGRPWLLVQVAGAQVFCGPLIRPGQGPCWQCLAHRLRLKRQLSATLEHVFGSERPACPAPGPNPTGATIMLSLAAQEIFKYIITGTCALDGRIQAFDSVGGKFSEHIVVHRPQCSECGDPTSSLPKQGPLNLKSRRKAVRDGGGHRVCSPEATLARFSHHVSPVCGIVDGLQSLVDDESGVVHVHSSPYQSRAGSESMTNLAGDMGRSATGKGKSQAHSQASALAEALERYSWRYSGEESSIKASLNELGDEAMHPNRLMLFSKSQYRNRAELMKDRMTKHRIPAPFNTHETMDWIRVWNVTRNKPVYLPAALCCQGYPLNGREPTCIADTNGNSAGNVLEEAVLQGFMEVVERDAASIWWYNRLTMPAVDLTSFDDPYITALQEYYETCGKKMWMLSLATDFCVPIFLAVSCDPHRRRQSIALGFGAHFDALVAATRALTEMNQMLCNVDMFSQNREFQKRENELRMWYEDTKIEDHQYLCPKPETPLLNHRDFSYAVHADLLDDVRACVALADSSGMDVLLLDQTRPDVGMPVVKVMVPGMRFFQARFAPGRLYDVPVKLGLLGSPTAEEQMNPHCFPF